MSSSIIKLLWKHRQDFVILHRRRIAISSSERMPSSTWKLQQICIRAFPCSTFCLTSLRPCIIHFEPYPSGKPGTSDVFPRLNLRAVIWFYFTIFSLVLLPTLIALSVLFFFFLIVFFLFSLVNHKGLHKQLGDDSWSVVCVACCHMALSLLLCVCFSPFLFFYLVDYR